MPKNRVEDMPEDMPNNFYIIYEMAVAGFPQSGFMTLLDTRNNIVGKYLGGGQYASVYYQMPHEHLQAIYDGIAKYRITAYRGSLIKSNKWVSISDNRTYRITFWLYGTVYPILWDGSTSSGGGNRDLFTFVSSVLVKYYADNDAYQSLPEASWP
ncbi:MAG: hypothetical protein FWF18_01165 [Dehalococcoidia bacterium]|nr:hypothetical protein [Dehalococcoidia bacterium]